METRSLSSPSRPSLSERRLASATAARARAALPLALLIERLAWRPTLGVVSSCSSPLSNSWIYAEGDIDRECFKDGDLDGWYSSDSPLSSSRSSSLKVSSLGTRCFPALRDAAGEDDRAWSGSPEEGPFPLELLDHREDEPPPRPSSANEDPTLD